MNAVIASFILFSSLCAFSQEKSADKSPDLSWKDGWLEHGRELKKNALDEKGQWILGIGTGLVLLAVPFDDDVFRHMQDDDNKLDRKTAEFGSKLGGGVPTGVIALGQLLLDRDNGIAHTEALVYASLTHNITKFIVQRRRPDRPQRESFPSGHTANAFAAATSLAYAYGWPVGMPAYALSVLVGLSRMSDGVHFTSDILGGALIGVFWGHATRRGSASTMQPYFDLQRGVIGWEWKF